MVYHLGQRRVVDGRMGIIVEIDRHQRRIAVFEDPLEFVFGGFLHRGVDRFLIALTLNRGGEIDQ